MPDNNRPIDPIVGEYLTTQRVTSGLVLKLTTDGRARLEAMREVEYEDVVTFDRPHADVLRDLVTDMTERRELHLLRDSEYEILGAMTSAPILVTLPSFKDGELTAFDAAFWFPNYQVQSELETLLRKGEVTFDLATDPQDLNTCECGFQTYIVERMHDHKCDKGNS